MDKLNAKYKLGTADTVMLAVGTLAIDYICTSQKEILEVQPGGKKQYPTREALEEKVKQYGIKRTNYYPGSGLGNFINQAQELTFVDPSYKSIHLATTLATNDPLTKNLLDSLHEKGIQYNITEFTADDATNPIALLVESNGYTKILSFKDRRIPAIQVATPKDGLPGLVMIGVSAGDVIQTKKNALHYAKKHKLPVGVLTTEGEINQVVKNNSFKEVFRDVMSYASFFAANVDEVKTLLLAENHKYQSSTNKIQLAQHLRQVFENENLDILLSFGSEGSLVLVGNTAVLQKIPKVSHLVSTAGAGDALAGAFVEGVRIKGMDVAGVAWALPRANRAAQNVLKYADTRTGQVTGAQFLEEPPAEYEIEIINL